MLIRNNKMVLAQVVRTYRYDTQMPIWSFLSTRWSQSKVRAYTMLIPVGENVTLFSDFSLEIADPFL